LLCFASAHLTAQIRVSGFVIDSLSGERLIGVNIVEIGAANGTTSDNNGYFTLMIRQPSVIQLTYVGYKPVEIRVEKAALVEIRMSTGIDLPEVVVTARRWLNPGVASLATSELLNIPALGGKPDVLKAAQLLPGVNPQSEGSSLLSVRGGNPGENLYLLDGIPLIYVNHLGGFMSVFNPDMINGMDIYKSGFPAMYGGKLSSIMDITQREGNMDGWKGTFSIGVTDMSFSAEGPTKQKNSSFILTGRKTFTEALLGTASYLSNGNNNIVMYGFHDINAKYSWKPNVRNSLHLNFYQGDDYLNFRTKRDAKTGQSRMNTTWGNWLISARWNHVLNPKMFVRNSLSYTRYRLADRMRFEGITDGIFSSSYLSSVQDVSLCSDWKYPVLDAWRMDFGLQATHLVHLPNRTRQSNLSAEMPDEKYRAWENAVYMDNKINLFRHFNAHIGGRTVFYAVKGFTNHSLEPRLRLDVDVTKNHALHLGYMTVSQNSHLLFTAGGIMNNEVWVPAGSKIPVAVSGQYTAGWSGAFYDGMIQAEVDVYYKQLRNLSNYREGYMSLMGDTDWQSKIVTGGKGDARGIEFLLRKTTGLWTGFASWSWSKATRQYPDINDGKSYIYEFDRPHTVSLSLNKQLNDRWTFNMTWVFMSGLPYTPAIGRQLLTWYNEDEYLEALMYGERNSARMKLYHRMDIGLNHTILTHRNRKAVWTFSIYNAYNRRNPYFYYYSENGRMGEFLPGFYDWGFGDSRNHTMSLYQVSFFPIIPTVSYKLYFDRNEHKIYKANQPPKQKSFKNGIRRIFYFE